MQSEENPIEFNGSCSPVSRHRIASLVSGIPASNSVPSDSRDARMVSGNPGSFCGWDMGRRSIEHCGDVTSGRRPGSDVITSPHHGYDLSQTGLSQIH